MNKRINELANECYYFDTCTDLEMFDKEKFAQLIVRDCALTAGIMEYEGRAGIGAQLLDNFGVKE